MCIRIAAAVVVVLALSVSTVIATAGPLREASVRAAREASAEQQSPQRVRSGARTATGAILIIAGIFTPFNWGERCPAGEEISYLGYDCYADATKEVTAEYAGPGRLVAGLGMIGVGTMLATVWSEVPVGNSIDLRITPDRVQVGKTFGW